VLVGRGDQLRAVDRLQRGVTAAEAARQPLAGEAGRGREGATVEALDDLHQAVLVRALDLALEPPGPRPLAVALAPDAHRVGEQVQLHAALALAGPDVRQGAAELRVPEQRRQVVQGDHHPDVVDRAVGDRLDRAVGERAPAEEPDVAGRGLRHGRLEGQDHDP
jgi:hypothetical protein